MTVELITGQGSTDHINSEDVGAYQARTFGTGCYVLHGCECTVVDSNTVRVAEGELLIEGRHVRVKGSEDLAIRSGAAGYKRNDLIVVSYTKDQDNIEDAPLAVVPGTATEGTASDPSHVQGSILDGDVAAEHPLYRIPIDGLAVGEPVLLMDRQGPFVGHKHSASSIEDLNSWLLDNVFKVGFVWTSYVNKSPASILGGTWTAITGRFPYFNAGTSTGGSNTNTLTTAQIPSHNHSLMDNVMLYAAGNGGPVYGGGTTSATMRTNSGYTGTGSAGGGAAHNNMPAYQTLYAWRRTA